MSEGNDQDFGVELDVDHRERKAIDETTTDVELAWNAADSRPIVGAISDRGLGSRNVLIESNGGEHVSASVPAHRVEELGAGASGS